MKPLLLALAALLLLLAPAEARSRCGPGEAALKHGGCATLRPHSAVPLPQGRLCYGGGRADRLGRCPSAFCPDGMSPDASGHCRRAGLCPNGRTPDARGRCGQGNLCANGEPAVAGVCPELTPEGARSYGHAPLTPGPPVVPLPQSAPLRVQTPTVTPIAPPPPTYTPGAGLH